MAAAAETDSLVIKKVLHVAVSRRNGPFGATFDWTLR